MNKKDFIRKQASAVRKELLFRDEKDCKIRQKVLKLISGMNADSLFLYVSMNGEVDTIEIIRKLIGRVKLYVPHTSQGIMRPVLLSVPADKIIPDRWGNIYSDEALLAVDLKENLFSADKPSGKYRIDVTLVPLLAFDGCGNRLGYGKGCYDRFLSEAETFSVGLAYDEQQFDFIETEDHDVPLDVIVTPTRVIRRSLLCP